MENRQRYLSLDILKGIGIIYLIFTHHIVWQYIQGDAGGLIYPQARSVFRFFGAGSHILGAQIPLLAGITFVLALQSKSLRLATVFKRALLLAALGYAMNLFAWGPYAFLDSYDWDVLQLIALSMSVTGPLIKKLPVAWSAAVLILLGMFAVGMSDRFPLSKFYDSYFYKMFIGDAEGEHYWPFFPWFALFAAGSVIGALRILDDKRKLKGMAVTGLVMVLWSVGAGKFLPVFDYDNFWGPTLFKPAPEFVIGIIGGSLMWISLTHLLLALSPKLARFLEKSGLVYYGVGILWIYVITTIVGYHLTVSTQLYFNLDFKDSLILLPILISISLMLGLCIGKITWNLKTVRYSGAP